VIVGGQIALTTVHLDHETAALGDVAAGQIDYDETHCRGQHSGCVSGVES